MGLFDFLNAKNLKAVADVLEDAVTNAERDMNIDVHKSVCGIFKVVKAGGSITVGIFGDGGIMDRWHKISVIAHKSESAILIHLFKHLFRMFN